MTDLLDKTILVTGSTDGIGRLSAEGLAARGARLLVHGRDQGRIDATVDAIAEATGNGRIQGYRADFAELDQVGAMADRLLAEHDRLHVLVNNAGIGSGGQASQVRELSLDGFELRLQVNYLATFLLTRRLLPVLEAAAPARIVHVSSIGQMAIDLDDPMMDDGYSGRRACCQSKLAMILFAMDLAETIDPGQVTINAMHPGTLLDTKMVRQAFRQSLGQPSEGAETTIHLATAPELAGVSGRYFDQKREARADDQAYDAEARARLRRISLRLCGLEAA